MDGMDRNQWTESNGMGGRNESEWVDGMARNTHHALGLFEKIGKAYDVCLTRNVFEEARYYKKDGVRIDIDIKDVTIIENVDFESLRKVQREAREAMLAIDPGESTSIAYLAQTEEEITFCSCDQAAIKLISYMELEQKSISLERL